MERIKYVEVLNSMDYALCLELVKGLEIVKKYYSKNSQVIPLLADLIHKYQMNDLKLLSEIAESLLSVINEESEAKARTIAQWISPQELIEAQVLLKEISPWVREIRTDIFNKDESPFPDRESALIWLKDYALSDKELSSEVQNVKEISIGGEASLPIIAIEGQLFLPETPPADLYNRTKVIADNTGINHPSLIIHVLTNSRIICQKWDLTIQRIMQKLPSGKNTETKGITIRFRDTLNMEDMRQLYRTIKGDFGFKKSKALKGRHLELFNLVEERGIPQKGKVVFWKKIKEEWNRRHPESTYSTWKGINMAYIRIMKNTNIRLYMLTSE